MYLRSKENLKTINENSLSVKVFGKISHSELLKIQLEMKINPLNMIGADYSIVALYNTTRAPFINNSLGFTVMVGKDHLIPFLIPLDEKTAIYMCAKKYLNDNANYMVVDNPETVNRICKFTCATEYQIGNGFIFAKEKENLIKYAKYVKQMLNKVSTNVL